MGGEQRASLPRSWRASGPECRRLQETPSAQKATRLHTYQLGLKWSFLCDFNLIREKPLLR